jgi:hypothetical protein
VNADALGSKPLQVWVAKGVVIVGVLEPDCHETIEDLLYRVNYLLRSVRNLD